MARVFFISRSPRFDYSSAGEFGEAVFITEDREVSPFSVDRLMEAIEFRLDEWCFNPEADFIAVTGPAALVALFTAYAGALALASDTALRLLMFNAGQGKYQERRLALTTVLRALRDQRGT